MRGMRVAVALAGLAAAAAGPAAATVSQVKTIHVESGLGASNAPDAYIQIAELIATEQGTGVDVALAANGATANASSVWGDPNGAVPANAIDGVFPRSFYDSPGIFHSGNGVGQFLNIVLAGPRNLSSLTIYGRTDCCNERDTYIVTFLDALDRQIGGPVAFDNTALAGMGNTIQLPDASNGGGVPEPAAWALMIAGFGLAGGAARRRRARGARA